MKRITAITTAIILILSLCGCIGNVEVKGELSIVTTIFPAYDFARAVTGGKADISMLLSLGAEVHSFDPTPQDMIKIQTCDLFIYNGGESDEWVERLLSTDDYKNVNTLRMMDCVTLVDEETKEGMHTEETDEKESDEHIWTSPKNAIKIVNAIAEKLSEKDGDNARGYKANADDYCKLLLALDAEFTEIANSIDNPVLVFADRFPMRYFTDEYGFEYFAAFPGCSSKTEPAASTVTFLIEKVKAENIPCVFCIEFSDGKLADTICAETGAKKYTLHSCHNLSANDFEKGTTYVDIMQENAKTLREAFGVK